MTSALATGRAAFVTLPRMFKKVGRASGRAVPAVARMADANAKARSRRIAPLLPQPRVYGAAGCEVKRSTAHPPGGRRAASGERVTEVHCFWSTRSLSFPSDHTTK